ncbi:unnamed protein product [Mytilus edulis]|uniref:Uncharacterized protein n=1 Tax=Mytilus edulis TaxID=6550 RepID=A0A8S3SXJ1_MYTED|nr:unnamed protein product [Mytilus edulis]
MSPRESAVEENNKIMTSIRETTQQIAESMTENDGDVQNLLASGKSFLQYERERLQTCYVTTDQAERQADDLQTKLASGKKPKTHIGKYTNYNFNRQEFLEEVKNCKSTIMNWTRMAIKYNVTLNGKLAGNGVQILKAIKLSKFIENLQLDGKISSDISQLINSLVEIINIANSSVERRTPRQILRLYNQTFLFAVLSKSIIGIPVKMTQIKFYGCHFHSLVVHLQKSILAEQEKRTFESLRRLAEGTTNRKPGWIVDNTILRFNSQQTENRICSFSKQNSVISQQSKLLSKRENTIFPKEIFGIKSSLFQSHLERIADFLIPGYNIWWHYNGTELVFHDSVDEPEFRMQGPDTTNFRSTSLKK